MIDGGAPDDTRKQLEEWLNRIQAKLQRQVLSSEKELDNYVRIVPEFERELLLEDTGGKIPPTLLEILGFSIHTCLSQPKLMTIVHGRIKWSYRPDYVVMDNQKDAAIWDLKAANENLDKDEYVSQITTYCHASERPSPIGILFNGSGLRVFINPDYPGLSKYKKISDEPEKTRKYNFRCNPVVSVELADNMLMTDTLMRLSAKSLSGNATKVAKDLAEKKWKEINDGIRRKMIIECLMSSLSNPSDGVIEAIATVKDIWYGLEPEPTPDDAVRVWQKRKHLSATNTLKNIETNAKQSINAIVRARVAEVCNKKGWDCLAAAEVKGLRWRTEGGNGYHPLPQNAGVPENLHIGGLSAGDAKRVIQHLETLLKP